MRATEPALRHLADLRNGTTMWSVDLARVSAGVQRHPWVERVHAKRRFPNTVVVTVEEYEPVALLAYDDGLYYLDDGGTPFLRADSGDLDYPVLTGIDTALERSNPNLPRLVIRDALWLLDEIDSRSLLGRDVISEIGFHRTHGFTVHTGGPRSTRIVRQKCSSLPSTTNDNFADLLHCSIVALISRFRSMSTSHRRRWRSSDRLRRTTPPILRLC